MILRGFSESGITESDNFAIKYNDFLLSYVNIMTSTVPASSQRPLAQNPTPVRFIDTFRSAPQSLNLIEINSIDEAKHYFLARKKDTQNVKPVLILGGGSNTLFVEDFVGDILINKIKGIEVTEQSEQWSLHVGSGEVWHDFVKWMLDKAIYGYENLALIPGSVGAAPIQNIGAYGVELKAYCAYVDVLNLESLEIERISAEACQFGYRDSIFKTTHKEGYMIVAVGFIISKNWQPVVNYGELKALAESKVDNHLTAKDIFDAVCNIRRQKLPDPAQIGNAGSFFKNPLVNRSELDKLTKAYPNMPFYLQNQDDANSTEESYAKLAAGWLIDQAGFKGFQLGNAAVHQNQALVIVNTGNASGLEIAKLAKFIQTGVLNKFGIKLEPEVRFIAQHGEIAPNQFLDTLD